MFGAKAENKHLGDVFVFVTFNVPNVNELVLDVKEPENGEADCQTGAPLTRVST
jgi:hypothetical protein